MDISNDFELPNMGGKEILITGGLGFIGSNIALRCVENNANVTLFDSKVDDLKNIKEIKGKVKIVKGDILDFDFIKELVKRKDVIFHLAAQTSHIVSMENPWLDIDVNCKGSINILEACRKNNPNVRIVFASTVTAAGVPKVTPVNEELQEFPVSIYDANKLIIERYMKLYYKNFGLKTTVLRLANVFGERQQLTNPKRGILNYMIGRVMLQEPIIVYGDGSFIRDYTYVQNFVDAFLLVAISENTIGEFYILGSGNGMTFKEMVAKVNENVKDIIGNGTEIKNVPFPEGEKKIDSGDFIADYSKLKKATGWYPRVSFEEGLKRTVLFYKERFEDYK